MTTGVERIKQNERNKPYNNSLRAEYIIVKQGNTISALAKEFGMSVSEFKQWTGLDKNTLNIGQKITFPTAKAKDGKGIYAIAREYGMTMAEFAKLNKIQDPNKYRTGREEVFYIKPKSTNSSTITPQKETKSTSAQVVKAEPSKTKQAVAESKAKPKPFNPQNASGVAFGVTVGRVISDVIEHKRQWGSSYTPEELSSKIYELSEEYYGAVGKPDFDALIDEINPKNASAVIETYTKTKNNEDKESLLFTILREIKSKPEAKKAAALKVYDALAEEKNAPPSKREVFVNELDRQFAGWGLINTNKLDSIIKEIMNENTPPEKDSEVSNVSKNKSAQNTKPSNSPKVISSKDFKIEQLPDRGYWSVGKTEDRSVRVLFGKPVAVVSKGKIVSETIKFEPYQNNTGELRGKTIMVNAGHGMKYQDTSRLDMGKPDAKDENGKQIEEWRKNRDYADILIKNLRQKGATVIFTNGDALNACNEKKKFKCDLFISIHCNAASNRKKSGVEIFYHEGAAKSKDFADKTGVTFGIPKQSVKSDSTTRFGKLGVLTNIGPKNCPSILLEMGYLTNPTDMRNIDSVADRQKKMDKLTQAIVSNKDKF